MIFRLAPVFAALLSLTASSVAQTTSGEGTPIVPIATEQDYARAVANVVSDHIIPAYGRLDSTTAALTRTTQDFCAEPDPVSRISLDTGFVATVKAWAGVDFFRFGPMAQGGRYERFAFFPDVHGTGARQLRRFLASEDKELLQPGALAAQSAAVQGLPAIIAVLFRLEGSTEDGDAGAFPLRACHCNRGEPQHYRCRGARRLAGILLPDGKTLAIANGGIETHPDYGREMLNLPTMDPSLAFVDLDGHLIAQYRLPARHHQLSIRHMVVGADGKIWFGTQWEGDPLETPSLVGRASIDGGLELVATPERELNDMRRYVGAMAASRDGTLISASAPRGGYVVHFSAETGRYAGRSAIADSSGITGYGAKTILASNGEGLIAETKADGRARPKVELPGIAFDNHLRVVA